MTLGAVIGIASLVAVVGAIVFGFWNGLKVKPGAELRRDTINGVSKHLPGGVPDNNDRSFPDPR